MSGFFPRTGSNRGFTLLELMVVLALLSIFLGFAIPRFFSGANGLEKAARWISAKSLLLFELARRETGGHVMVLDLDAGRMWTGREANGQIVPGDGTRTSEFVLAGGIRLDKVAFAQKEQTSGRAQIRFYGQNCADPARIYLAKPDGTGLVVQIRMFLPDPIIRPYP